MAETWKPRIAVLGSGAMGSQFGGLLAEGGLQVVLIDIWQDHIDVINRDGLKIVGFGGDRTIPIQATSDPQLIDPVDIVFVQCKATATADAVQGAGNIFGEDTLAISFRNGLGNEEVIAELIGSDRVLAA